MKRMFYLLLFVGVLTMDGLTSKDAQAYSFAYCKTCKKGKACGDSCIAKDKTCHQPKGCACDG